MQIITRTATRYVTPLREGGALPAIVEADDDGLYVINWLIDHVAALYFHHAGGDYAFRARDPFARIREHVLLPLASALATVDALLAARLAPGVVQDLSRPCPKRGSRVMPHSPRPPRDAQPTRNTCRRAWRRREPLSRRGCGPETSTYDYAVIRVVPRVECEEYVVVGVVVSCPERQFLEARIEFDPARIAALDPTLDLDRIRAHLATIPLICAGGDGAGPIGGLSPSERFRWLTVPRSAVIQFSPAHTGRCDHPDALLERLLATMVRVSRVPA